MKSKFLLILAFIVFLFTVVIALPITVDKNLIGYRHKGVKYGEKLPNGAQDSGGGLLSNENYGVTRFVKGKMFMLWLEKIVDRNATGIPSWEVRDVLTFDNLRKNQEFLFSYSSPCKQNKKENLDLIVLVEIELKTKAYLPVKAWQANLKKEKFENIPVKGIVCH
jgi:hypothetical protein